VTRHAYDCHVRFSDVDVYGHVNNVKYLEFYQEARLAFLDAVGALTHADSLGLVVARIDVDYRRPILFRPEPYVIESWVSRLGTSSFTLEAEISDGESVLSRACTVLVSFDLGTQRSRRLTTLERESLQPG
jgi:acyl-CoA thioester hydrolase